MTGLRLDAPDLVDWGGSQRFRLDLAGSGCVCHGCAEASKLCHSRDLHITLCGFYVCAFKSIWAVEDFFFMIR